MRATSAHWLDERRAKAANRFAALGVPHRRIEDWKYSDLRTVIDGANDDAAASWSIAALPQGVELFDLANADAAPDWVKAHLGTLPQNAMASSSFAMPVPALRSASRATKRPDRCTSPSCSPAAPAPWSCWKTAPR